MSAHQAIHPIRTLCRLLGVSESGYHAWRRRGPSRRAPRDLELLTQIRAFHARSAETYGAPRTRQTATDDPGGATSAGPGAPRFYRERAGKLP